MGVVIVVWGRHAVECLLNEGGRIVFARGTVIRLLCKEESSASFFRRGPFWSGRPLSNNKLPLAVKPLGQTSANRLVCHCYLAVLHCPRCWRCMSLIYKKTRSDWYAMGIIPLSKNHLRERNWEREKGEERRSKDPNLSSSEEELWLPLEPDEPSTTSTSKSSWSMIMSSSPSSLPSDRRLQQGDTFITT